MTEIIKYIIALVLCLVTMFFSEMWLKKDLKDKTNKNKLSFETLISVLARNVKNGSIIFSVFIILKIVYLFLKC